MKNNYFKPLQRTKFSETLCFVFGISTFLLLTASLNAQEFSFFEKKVDDPVCVFKQKIDAPVYNIGNREELRSRIANNDTPCTTFEVTYIGFESFPEAQAAFQEAVDIWSLLISSPQTVRIEANFTDLGGVINGSIVLGSARPRGFFAINDVPGVQDDTWYPRALLEKLLDQDIIAQGENEFEPSIDILTNFNSNSQANWYFGLDADPPNGFRDFVTVVLHEIGHGLGFTGQASIDDRTGDGSITLNGGPGVDLPVIYSRFIETGDGTDINTLNTDDLTDELTGNDLFCASPATVTANGGNRAKIFAPSTFNPGSSYSHWDENTFPGNSPQSLMTPSYSGANHDPGDITLGFFEDMGWDLCATLSTGPELVLESITISPVPFDNQLDIRIPTNIGLNEAEISIIDITGKVIYQSLETPLGGRIQLKGLSAMEANMYFLSIKNINTGEVVTKKVIKR